MQKTLALASAIVVALSIYRLFRRRKLCGKLGFMFLILYPWNRWGGYGLQCGIRGIFARSPVPNL